LRCASGHLQHAEQPKKEIPDSDGQEQARQPTSLEYLQYFFKGWEVIEIRDFVEDEVGANGTQSEGDRVKDEPENDRLWVHGRSSVRKELEIRLV
jgi:hypothetical protein